MGGISPLSTATSYLENIEFLPEFVFLGEVAVEALYPSLSYHPVLVAFWGLHIIALSFFPLLILVFPSLPFSFSTVTGAPLLRPAAASTRTVDTAGLFHFY